MVGDGIQMAVDFGYRWHNWHDALHVLERIGDCDIFFAEAALQHDDLAGHAELAAKSGSGSAARKRQRPAGKCSNG